MNKIRDKFDETVKAAKKFALKFEENIKASSETDPILKRLRIDQKFAEKRVIRTPKRADEKCRDEPVGSAEDCSCEDQFRITVFNRILDKITQTMDRRFSDQKNLYLDLSVFDPKNFDKIKDGLPIGALDKICKLIPSLDESKLREKILTFANIWPSISRKFAEIDYASPSSISFESESNFENYANIEKEEYFLDYSNISEEFHNEEDSIFHDFIENNFKKCNNCIKCAFEIIICTVLTTHTIKLYKHLLKQVSCERIFSKLKLIKTRLRSTMTDENLEALILMHSERDLLNAVDANYVIDKLCESSLEMKNLLSL